MINRVLIRIKVVQMLYSYLLTKSEFKISGVPDKQTRDNMYAYKVYVRMLMLILKLSGQKLSPGDKALDFNTADGKNLFASSPVAISLVKITDVKELGVKYAEDLAQWSEAIIALHTSLSNQSIVKETAKKRKNVLAADVTMWITLFESIISKDHTILDLLRSDDDFTIAGMERGVAMTIDTLKGYSDTQSTFADAKKSLEDSLDQAHLLYYALMWLPVVLTKMQYDQIEAAKDKYLPTAEDLNPNTRFVENAYVAALRESEQMAKYFKDCPFSWESDYYMLKQLLDKIIGSEIYAKYMDAPSTDYTQDAELWRNLMKSVILPSDTLADILEGRSVYWNDDLLTIGTFVLKSIRRCATAPNHQIELLPEFKDDEDARFGYELFTDTVNHFDEYRQMLDSTIDSGNWDPERIAFMDTVIIAAALSEIINFPKIPLVVSINEYIEIANYYSTPRSGQFVNGVLYSLCNRLIEDGRIHKQLGEK